MNIKNDNKHIYQQLNLKNKLSKQLELEPIHRNRDHTGDYQWGGGRGRMGDKVQGIRNVIGRYIIDRKRLRII